MPYNGGTDVYVVPTLRIDSITAPAEAPLHIVPTAAPTGTQEVGNIYVTTTGGLKVSNGTGFMNAGGLAGDWLEVTASTGVLWEVYGFGRATGAEATPWKTS